MIYGVTNMKNTARNQTVITRKNKSKQAIFKPNSNKGVLKHIAI